jgi:peptide/nickel transport system permease protein
MTSKSASFSTVLAPPLAANRLFDENQSNNYWAMAWRALRQDRLTILALTFILLIALLAASAGLIARLLGVDPYSTNPGNAYQQPYWGPYLLWRLGLDNLSAPLMLGKSEGVVHWLGTDQLGRDLLARLLYGGRISLMIGLVAATISLFLGVLVGALAGYFGGYVDDLIMWVINTVTTIPIIYLLIIINSIFAPNAITLTLFLGLSGWFGTARFMRGSVFKVRELDYTQAARAIGSTNGRIILQHVIPNTIPLIVVLTAVDVGGLILTESILSFLGLGVQPPTASWGNMLNRANSFVFLRDPQTQQLMGLHLLLGPGLLTTLTVLAFSLIGDGLRDALDPTLKNKK